MELNSDEVEELKRAFGSTLGSFKEGGLPFIFIEKLPLPSGCEPEAEDALLCPHPRDGYPSRLFLASQIKLPMNRNWNAKGVRIGDRNWFAVSWKIEPNLRLMQMVAAHLGAFR